MQELNKTLEYLPSSLSNNLMMYQPIPVSSPQRYKLKDIKFEIVNATDTRVKYVNKLLNAVVLKKTEKTSLNLCYLQVFADGEVVLASPAEFSRDDIITSKLHNAFRVLEENGEVYCSVPPVGIVFEVL